MGFLKILTAVVLPQKIDIFVYLLKAQWVTIFSYVELLKGFRVIVVLEQALASMVRSSVYWCFMSEMNVLHSTL